MPLSVVLLAWIILGGETHAQEKVPLPVEAVVDSWTFDYTSPPRFSPGGGLLVYAVSPSARDNGRTFSVSSERFRQTGIHPTLLGQQIRALELRTREDHSLTEGIGSNWGPSWSPDGQYLAFFSDRDKSGQAKLWVWERTRNALRKVSDVPVRAFEAQWLPDSRRLVTVLALDEPETTRNDNGQAAPAAPRTGDSTATVYSFFGKSSHETAGPWNLELEYPFRDLGLIDVVTGTVQIVSHRQRIAKFLLGPNGSSIVYTSPVRFEKAGSQQTLFDIIQVGIADGRAEVLARDVRLDLSGATLTWAPDGLGVVYQTGGMEGNGDCYFVDSSTGASRKLTSFAQETPYYSGRVPLWDPDGRHFYFVRRGAVWKVDATSGRAQEFVKSDRVEVTFLIGQKTGFVYSPKGSNWTLAIASEAQTGEMAFYRIDLRTGQLRQSYAPGLCFACVRAPELAEVSPADGALVFFGGDAGHDVNLWLTDPEFKHPSQLTRINPQFTRYSMGSARLVEWLNLDGTKLRGALLLPPDYQEGRCYPLIVKVYGGAKGSATLGFFGFENGVTNLQLFATRGYAVLFPDAPTRLGNPMWDIAQAILPGINKVIEMGIADPKRIGVIGHSYGGYTTLALLAQSIRFKAGVISDGMGDLVSSYGELSENGSAYGVALMEGGQGLMGGPPWQFKSRYVENSPIFYLDRVNAPLLLLHGGADEAVDPFLAGEIFVGLRRLGKTVQFAKYQGEGHDMNFWSRSNKIDFCERVIEWFDTYLKGAAP
jgi:dipeptidyl aminopeptidase/acylaminoacyl peptidase